MNLTLFHFLDNLLPESTLELRDFSLNICWLRELAIHSAAFSGLGLPDALDSSRGTLIENPCVASLCLLISLECVESPFISIQKW